MKIKGFIIIIILSLLYTKVEAQTASPAYTPVVNSILNLIKTKSGEGRLWEYPYLHKALYEVNDIDVHLRFNDEFRACRIPQNSRRLIT